ncbi:Glycoside hydrolase, partial [Globisporangium polare]
VVSDVSSVNCTGTATTARTVKTLGHMACETVQLLRRHEIEKIARTAVFKDGC